MIARETIEKIKDTMRIEDVVSEYMSLTRRGVNLVGLCPFHDERTPSFNVNPPRNIFNCFGCHEAGNAISFVMKIDNCTYPEALRKIAEIYHIPIKEEELNEADQQAHDDRESMLLLNKWAKEWFEKQLWETQDGQAIGLSYFHQRGLRDDVIKAFGLGYSPEKGNPLTRDAKQKGFVERYMVNTPDINDVMKSVGTGLSCKSQDGRLFDRFSARVMYPIFSVSGQVVGFAGRIMSDRKDVGKYVNSPESLIYSKRNELYGIYQAKNEIAKKKMAYLVEGQMDVISMYQAGIKNTICSGGTALTEGHVRKIHRFTENVTILYDGDSAGIHAALKAIKMFLNDKMQVRVMLFPEGDDPDSFSRKHTAEEFVAYIHTNAVDFVQYMVQVLLNPSQDMTERIAQIKEISSTISLITNAVERQMYIKEFADILGMSEATVGKDVTAIRKQLLRQQHGETPLSEPEKSADLLPGARPVQSQSLKEQFLKKIEQNYFNIAQMIVRHGNEVYSDNGDGTYLPIGLALLLELHKDDNHAENPLIERIFSEYEAHFADPGFETARYFSDHADAELSSLAAQMLFEEAASAKAEENFAKKAYHLICELKFNICDMQLRTEAANMNPETRRQLLSLRAELDKARKH